MNAPFMEGRGTRQPGRTQSQHSRCTKTTVDGLWLYSSITTTRDLQSSFPEMLESFVKWNKKQKKKGSKAVICMHLFCQ